jgi:hypothetical protein
MQSAVWFLANVSAHLIDDNNGKVSQNESPGYIYRHLVSFDVQRYHIMPFGSKQDRKSLIVESLTKGTSPLAVEPGPCYHCTLCVAPLKGIVFVRDVDLSPENSREFNLIR